MMKTVNLTVLFFAATLFFIPASLKAELSKEDEVKIVTDYLVKHENKSVQEARTEAIASVYGKPKFEDLVYDDSSEMFFGRLVPQKGGFAYDVNFYMPRSEAVKFQKERDKAQIEVYHSFKNNKLHINRVDVRYKEIPYPLKIKEPNTLTIKIGSYFVKTPNSTIAAKKNGLGTTINLHEFLGVKPQTNVFRIDGIYKFSPKHRMGFSYYELNSRSNKEINTDFIYEGETISVGSKVTSQNKTTISKVNYIYSAYQTNKLDLTFRAGLYILGLQSKLGGELIIDDYTRYGEYSNVSFTAPLPVFGLGLSYDLARDVTLNFVTDYFYLSINDFSGNIADSMISLDYHYNRYIGVGLGLAKTTIYANTFVDDVEYETNNEVVGGLAYVILKY